VYDTHLFLTTLAFTLAVFFLLWLVSLRIRDVSIVDVYWGPGFALIAALCFELTPEGAPVRKLLVTALAFLWGARLGLYLFWRNHGRGEDPRYGAMRARHGEKFARVSLVTVFGLQALLMWFISLPLQVAQVSPVPAGLTPLDLIGAVLWAVGIFFEAAGDWQLARFKADPANGGRVMDRGLWRYTRHPNYFGDFLVWWGFFLIACATPIGWRMFPSPLLMSYFLMRVSGVPLLERSLSRRKPAYREYVERTSAFFPRPPRG
jgi:steroid 5-alpha reductase family enzyme